MCGSSSLADLEGLVDDFHVASRLARGLLEPALERCELRDVLAEARPLDGDIEIEATTMDDAAGRWDRAWLAGAIAELARTAETAQERRTGGWRSA